MQSYSIKDAERITGIKAHTLRMWEKRYGIPVPQRSSTNIRSYSNDDLKYILNTRLLRSHGYKLAEIAGFSTEEFQAIIRRIAESSEDNQARLDAFKIAMISIDEEKFEREWTKSVSKLGFDKTVLEVAFPFLRQLGLLWQAGSAHPGEEHFIANLIRRKLIAAIDAQEAPKHGAKTFLLFLPQEELHELGLLFHSYLIRKHGHRSVYLGQSLPWDSAMEIRRLVEADYVVVSAMSMKSMDARKKFFEDLLDGLEESTLICGPPAEDEKLLPVNGKFIAGCTLSEFTQLLSENR